MRVKMDQEDQEDLDGSEFVICICLLKQHAVQEVVVANGLAVGLERQILEEAGGSGSYVPMLVKLSMRLAAGEIVAGWPTYHFHCWTPGSARGSAVGMPQQPAEE